MTAPVLRFARTCEACKHALHDRCWAYLGELMGHDYVPCPCDCRDEHGDLTLAALTEMARRQPEALARYVQVTRAIKRGSLSTHLRARRNAI